MQRMKSTLSGLRICALALVVSGCGGGGDASAPPDPPTPLPASVTIVAPAKAQSANNVAFAPSFSGTNGLKFKWDFGDGSVASADPAPTHTFAEPGDFQVTLTVSDASGALRNASFDVTVNNQANVRGLACSAADDAGWCWSRDMRGNGDVLNGTYFFDGQTGWAAGASGALYKSTDGGKTWASRFRLAGENFLQITFADTSYGWALTASRKLYASTDGGLTWGLQLDQSAEAAPPSYGSQQLVATDARHVALLGSYMPSKLSADGGQSWHTPDQTIEAISSASAVWGRTGRSTDYGRSFTPYGNVPFYPDALGFMTDHFGTLSVVNADVAVWQILSAVAGSYYRTYTRAVAVTTDGGATWTRREIGPDGPTSGCCGSSSNGGPTSVYASSADKLWALDGARVARSVDGGRSWTWLPKGPWPAVGPAGAPLIAASADSASPDSFSMTVLNDDDVHQSVLRTQDGGVTWKRYTPDGFPPPSSVATFKRLGPQTFVLQSGSRSLFRTDDDGAHWTLLAGPSAADNAVKHINFWDDKQGLALQESALLLSADGGQTWNAQGSRSILSLQVVAETVFARALKSPDSGSITMLVSQDRGKTWTDLNTASAFDSAYPSAMHFFDTKRGIALAGSKTYATNNGGATWARLGEVTQQSLLSAEFHFSFSNDSVGLVYDRDGQYLFATTDGGATWRPGKPPAGGERMRAYKLVDALHGWAVGEKGKPLPPNEGVLYETQDGGLTWVQKAVPAGSGRLNAIHFQTARLGWIVGEGGTILATRDAGATWARQDPGSTTREFTAVFFSNAKNGWLGGSAGEFMATGTGGN